MAYLSDDELLDTEGGFIVWDDKIGAGSVEETLEQALRKNVWQSWKASWSRTSIPSIMMPNWKPRKKKPPRSAKSG